MRGHTQAELDKELELAAAKTARKGREEDLQDEDESAGTGVDPESVKPEILHDAAQFAKEFNASAAVDKVRAVMLFMQDSQPAAAIAAF
jgi:hypothetical protein